MTGVVKGGARQAVLNVAGESKPERLGRNNGLVPFLKPQQRRRAKEVS
jgi:hypothetical protein